MRDDLEQVCIDTVFGAHGVQLLNEQGLAVMKEMGVPVVPAHMLVEGQQWATPVSARRVVVFFTLKAIPISPPRNPPLSELIQPDTANCRAQFPWSEVDLLK